MHVAQCKLSYFSKMDCYKNGKMHANSSNSKYPVIKIYSKQWLQSDASLALARYLTKIGIKKGETLTEKKMKTSPDEMHKHTETRKMFESLFMYCLNPFSHSLLQL